MLPRFLFLGSFSNSAILSGFSSFLNSNLNSSKTPKTKAISSKDSKDILPKRSNLLILPARAEA